MLHYIPTTDLHILSPPSLAIITTLHHGLSWTLARNSAPFYKGESNLQFKPGSEMMIT